MTGNKNQRLHKKYQQLKSSYSYIHERDKKNNKRIMGHDVCQHISKLRMDRFLN